MPFDSALTTDEKNYLRGTQYEGRVYLSVCSNTVVYTARINNSDWLFPLAQLPVDGGSGDESDIEIGMTVLLSHTNDASAYYWRGRIRESAGVGYILDTGAGQIYVNETGDLGFVDNDYVFILRDFGVQEKLPRDSGGYPIPDWNTSFRELLPIISNLRSAYADDVDATSEVLEIEFAPNCLAAASGAAIDTDTYQWTLPAGATITVGSDTDKDITVEFDPSDSEYWCKFEVSDDNGNTAVRRFPVWAHDADNPPILLSFSDLEIEADIPINVLEGAAGGYDATVRAFEGIEDILNNSLVVAWVDQSFGGTRVDIGSSGNILLVGRLRSEVNDTGYASGQRSASTSFEIEGVLSQLARLRFPSVRIEDSTSPTAFNEVKDLTIWRAIHLVLSEYSTFSELHSLTFDDSSDDFRMPNLDTQGGDLLNTVADLAQGISAVLQDNAAGMCEVARRLPMLPSADRSGVTTVLDLTTADFGGEDALSLALSHVKLVGQVKGDGGGYDTADEELSGYSVRAPNGAPLGASGDGQIPRQVLIADQTAADEKAELAQRAGNALAAQNGAATLVLHHPDGFHALTPDAQARYTLTLPASETAHGRAYTTTNKWWLQHKRLSVNPKTGRIETRFTFMEETSGAAGRVDVFPAIDLGENPVDLTDYEPNFDLPSSQSGEVETDPGDWTPSLVGSCTDGQNYIDAYLDIGEVVTIETITVEYTATESQVGLIFLNQVLLRTPSESYIQAATWITESGTHTLTFDVGGVPAQYIRLIAYGDEDDCTDTIEITAVSYTTTGEVTFSHRFDFTVEDGGFVTDTGVGTSTRDGSGWTNSVPDYSFPFYYSPIGISRSIPSGVVYTKFKMEYTMTRGAGIGTNKDWIELNGPRIIERDSAGYDGVLTLEITGSFDGGALGLVASIDQNEDPEALGGSGYITACVIEGLGPDPFAGE